MALDGQRRRLYTSAVVNETATPLQSTGRPPTAADLQARQVAVVGDEPATMLAWARALGAEGLTVHVRGDATADAAASPDAWVLHVSRSLPEHLARLRALDGRVPRAPLVAVCQTLRDLDHVLALEMGADDVIDGAMPAPVVAARLRALWRRLAPAATSSPAVPDCLRFGDLVLQRRDRRTNLRGSTIALTDSEFELLWLLALQAGRVVPRRELVKQLRGLDYERHDRSIDCRIYRIRRKLGDEDAANQRVRTVRNRGYLFAASPW